MLSLSGLLFLKKGLNISMMISWGSWGIVSGSSLDGGAVSCGVGLLSSTLLFLSIRFFFPFDWVLSHLILLVRFLARQLRPFNTIPHLSTRCIFYGVKMVAWGFSLSWWSSWLEWNSLSLLLSFCFMHVTFFFPR